MHTEYYTMTAFQRVYYRHKAAGMCAHCGKSPPWNGTTLCGLCWRKHRECETRHADRRREYRRARWAYRRENGLCVDCGKPAIAGQARCEYHQMLVREKAHVKLVRERINGCGMYPGREGHAADRR